MTQGAAAEEPASDGSPATVPDVTVVVPVYNTMPYLTACLQSLVDQSIGPARLHVVAVDDGSTDGSGEELDRFAGAHPDLFTVVHQDNSGGPAAPCNRGLELATGRFVFFLGADDYLGVRALEQLVAAADEWDSDVVVGKMVGVGGRGVSQDLFRRTRSDVPFPGSRLTFALANTKLFRRSLIEEHHIRYPLDLRVGSDQPFTIAAMLRARRISVLADEPYYYAVRREGATNITFSSGWRARLEDIGTVMDHVAEIVGPGEDRDRILHRHFSWELNNRLRDDFSALGETEQAELAVMVGALADRYLTDGVSRRLSVGARVRLRLAQAGRLPELRAVLAEQRAGGRPPLVLADGRAMLALPGYGELPADWFESRVENLAARVEDAVRVTGLAWRGSVLQVSAATGLHPASRDAVALELRPLPGKRRVTPLRRLTPRDRKAERPLAVGSLTLRDPDGGGADDGGPDSGGAAGGGPDSGAADGVGAGGAGAVGGAGAAGGAGRGATLAAELDVAAVLERAPGRRRRWVPRLVLDAGERVFDAPLVADEDVPRDTVTHVRCGGAWYRLLARVGPGRRLVVVRQPVTWREVPRRELLRAAADPVRRTG